MATALARIRLPGKLGVVENASRFTTSGSRWKHAYYQKLRRPTVVAERGRKDVSIRSPGPKHLKDLARLAERSVFISWKWNDNARRRRVIREFTRALSEEKVMVWLDLLAFSMSPALSKVRENNDQLEKHLKYGYERCKAVVAIGTQHYGELTAEIPNNKNWTKREWKGTIVPGKRIKKVVYPFDAELPTILDDADHCLARRSPRRAAKELREYLDDIYS